MAVCVLRLFYSINLMYLLNARGCLEWGATRTRGGGSKQNKLSRRVCNVCLWQCACMLRLFYSINLMYLLNARGSMLMFGKHRSANICFDVSQGSADIDAKNVPWVSFLWFVLCVGCVGCALCVKDSQMYPWRSAGSHDTFSFFLYLPGPGLTGAC